MHLEDHVRAARVVEEARHVAHARGIREDFLVLGSWDRKWWCGLTKVAMEKACMAENLLRMTRCHSSPFSKEPLLSLLGLLADTEHAEQILRGTFVVPEGTDQYVRDIINQLQRPSPDKCIPKEALHLSAEKIAQAWKRRRPNTQAEPSGLSFPHHICGAYNPIIAEVDAALHSAPFQTGFAPPRMALYDGY